MVGVSELDDRVEILEKRLELMSTQLEIERKERLKLERRLGEAQPASTAGAILAQVASEKRKQARIANAAKARAAQVAAGGPYGRNRKPFYLVECNCGKGDVIEGHKGPKCPRYNWLRRWGAAKAKEDLESIYATQGEK